MFTNPILNSKEFIRIIVEYLLEKSTVPPKRYLEQFEEEYLERIAKYEKRFERGMIAVFREQERNVLANMKKIKEVKKDLVDFYVFGEEEWNEKLEELEKEEFKKINKEEQNAVLRWLALLAILPVGFSLSEQDPYVERVMEEFAYSFARQVNGTTLSRLKREIEIGINNGESMSQLRERIRSLFSRWVEEAELEVTRALTIGRTEAVKMANFASNYVYMKSGVVGEKIWITVKDDRTCPFCASMDGKRIGVSESFFSAGDKLKVGSGELTFSSDVDAPPIHPHCRCFLAFSVKDVYSLLEYL